MLVRVIRKYHTMSNCIKPTEPIIYSLYIHKPKLKIIPNSGGKKDDDDDDEYNIPEDYEQIQRELYEIICSNTAK
jgi:hypothetical protein